MDKFIENTTLDGDVRMFANLPSAIQTDLLSEMSREEIKRYIWFVHENAQLDLNKWTKINKKLSGRGK